MSLEDIFRALEVEAQSRCAEIRAKAAEDADQLSGKTGCQCEEIIKTRLENAAGPVTAKARRIENQARLEARRRIAAEREAQVDEIFEAARGALASVRGSKEYAARFGALFDEAVAEAGEASSVQVDPADEDLARQVLAERGIALPVVADIKSAGGMVVRSAGDRVRHDNTLETRLSRLREDSRAQVRELLYG